MAAAPGGLDALLHNLSQRLVQAPALPAIPAEAETTASSTPPARRHNGRDVILISVVTLQRTVRLDLRCWSVGEGGWLRDVLHVDA